METQPFGAGPDVTQLSPWTAEDVQDGRPHVLNPDRKA